jgi:hypothetical protein
MRKVHITFIVCTLLTPAAAATAKTLPDAQTAPGSPKQGTDAQTEGQTSTQSQPSAQAEAPTPAVNSDRRVADFQAQARGLSSMPADPQHPGEIKALRTLADTLDGMPGADTKVRRATASIRSSADALEQSPASAVHSDTMKSALTNAIGALDALQTSAASSHMATQVSAARDQVDKIDPTVPFLKQRTTIDQACVAIGDALALLGRTAVSSGPGVSGGPGVSPEERQPVSGQEISMAAPPPPRKPQQIFQLSLGGGVADFADNASKHLTEVGGMWDVRLLVGESLFVGAEFAYVGTANKVNNVMAQFAPNGTILGTGLEGDFRLQLPRAMFPVRPFGFWGLGWNEFSLVNELFRNAAAIQAHDSTLVMPLGAGLQFNVTDHLALDTRFTYRAVYHEDLLHTDVNGVPGAGRQGMSQWAASARLGYTF